MPSQEAIAWRIDENTYRFEVEISQDDNGIYSVVSKNLPGVGSCASTLDGAMSNFREAASETLKSYLDSGEEIPWSEIPDSGQRRVVVVRVG